MRNPGSRNRPTSLPTPLIFVCYHYKDRGFGMRLVQDLRFALSDDTAVWHTVDGGPQGADKSWTSILEELSIRNVYIFVLSPDAISSSWVKSEISIALRQHVSQAGKLIPVIYRRCKIPQGYDVLQNVSFRSKPYEVAFNELLLTVMRLPAKKIGMILSMRRVVQFLSIILLMIVISSGSIFASYQFLQPKPITRVYATSTVPGTTPVTPTVSVVVPTPNASITPLPNLYPHPSGTLNNDPLGNVCSFNHGVYHQNAEGQLFQFGQFNIDSCFGGESVSNFVYEIQMTIVKGDFGGVMFRYQPPPTTSPTSRYYDFLVGSDGTYQFILTGVLSTLANGTSHFINKGQNVQNTLAVVAVANHLDLYINQHIVASVKDTSFTQGQIGITAAGINHFTEVTFANPKIWLM